MTKYKLKYEVENKIIKDALELVIKDDYGLRKDVYGLRRNIIALFPDVRVKIFSISRSTRTRELKP